MSVFFIPSIISLIFNLCVLGYVIKGARVSNQFLALIVVFALHNLMEFVGYFYHGAVQSSDMLFRLYYVASIYVVLYMLLHAFSVSKFETFMTTAISVGAATTIAALVLFSDQIISGYYSIGYTLSAEIGSYYALFIIYMFGALTAGFVCTFLGYRRAQSQLDSFRCLLSLWALAPISLTMVLAMIFKIANISVNATGLMPIATTLFIVIVLKTESKHKLSDIRRVMPLSVERQTTNNLMDLLDNYIQESDRSNVYKELHAGIEKEIIMYSLQKCDNNITYTAEMMGLKNRSTLYSMINRLGIDLNELKLKKTLSE